MLKALETVLTPLLHLLLAHGIDYTQLTACLKPWVIEQARQELLRGGQRDTDSAISLLSGVHRKDVRAWRLGGLRDRFDQVVPYSTQVFARWLDDPLYRDRRKRAKPLLRSGPAPSFESLARSVTQDVHPFTLLGELLRLGLVRVEVVRDQEMVIPAKDGHVPQPGSSEMLAIFSANLGDHARAAAANMLSESQHLEQSVFAQGITPRSAAKLGALARKLWAQARQEMIGEAHRLYQQDQGLADATARMRFGAYFWDEKTPPMDNHDELE